MKPKVKIVTLKDMKLLAPADGLCHKCATNHEEEQPHNQQSLHWQYYFRQNNDRWPTWKDAMAHCSEEVKALWIAALKERGITVYDAQKNK